jgi:hypothetical protein
MEHGHYFKQNVATLKAKRFREVDPDLLWAHRDRRIAFRYEALDDNPPKWLLAHLDEPVDPTDFVFHFHLRTPDASYCKEMLRRLRLEDLRPVICKRTSQSP